MSLRCDRVTGYGSSSMSQVHHFYISSQHFCHFSHTTCHPVTFSYFLRKRREKRLKTYGKCHFTVVTGCVTGFSHTCHVSNRPVTFTYSKGGVSLARILQIGRGYPVSLVQNLKYYLVFKDHIHFHKRRYI